jgi:aspartyl/asparaginyl-tRNA synthetase
MKLNHHSVCGWMNSVRKTLKPFSMNRLYTWQLPVASLKRDRPAVIQYSSSRLFSTSIPLPSQPIETPLVDYFTIDSSSGDLRFGDLQLIASQRKSDIEYTDVSKLGTNEGPPVGTKIWIRGRIATTRGKGNAVFLVIRNKSFYTIQTCHFKNKSQPDLSKSLLKFASNIPVESIVDICGEVTAAEVKSCTQHNVEIQIEKIFVVSRAPSSLPFLIDDASKSQEDIDKSQNSDRPFHPVHQVVSLFLSFFFISIIRFMLFLQDTRLNHRWLDLRVPANNAIMRIRSGISFLFREALLNENFVEINTPKLIAGESEGGSEVFRTDYFGQPACLAQSPQLYKQMAISADLDRVFEIGSVFRAENSNTRRHLCEFTGLDLEMAINSHYEETLQSKLFYSLSKHH